MKKTIVLYLCIFMNLSYASRYEDNDILEQSPGMFLSEKIRLALQKGVVDSVGINNSALGISPSERFVRLAIEMILESLRLQEMAKAKKEDETVNAETALESGQGIFGNFIALNTIKPNQHEEKQPEQQNNQVEKKNCTPDDSSGFCIKYEIKNNSSNNSNVGLNSLPDISNLALELKHEELKEVASQKEEQKKVEPNTNKLDLFSQIKNFKGHQNKNISGSEKQPASIAYVYNEEFFESLKPKNVLDFLKSKITTRGSAIRMCSENNHDECDDNCSVKKQKKLNAEIQKEKPTFLKAVHLILNEKEYQNVSEENFEIAKKYVSAKLTDYEIHDFEGKDKIQEMLNKKEEVVPEKSDHANKKEDIIAKIHDHANKNDVNVNQGKSFEELKQEEKQTKLNELNNYNGDVQSFVESAKTFLNEHKNDKELEKQIHEKAVALRFAESGNKCNCDSLENYYSPCKTKIVHNNKVKDVIKAFHSNADKKTEFNGKKITLLNDEEKIEFYNKTKTTYGCTLIE